MSSERALGWRRNPPNTPNANRGSRFAAMARRAGAERLPTCSLLRFKPRRLYQGGVGSCVAVGTKGMFLDWCAARGEEPFEVAERPLYWQARLLEYTYFGDSPERTRELVAEAGDTGSYPWLAFRAWSKLGLVPYSACPDSEPTTFEEIDRFVRVQPPPAAFAAGWEHRDLDTIEVDGVGVEKVRRLAELLQLRIPVGFGMTVDLAFMRNEGEVVESIDHRVAQGGHWMRALGVLRDFDVRALAGLDGDDLLRELESRELADPAEASHDSLVVFHNTWRSWGLPNGMGLMRAGAWAAETRDATGVEWLPTGGRQVPA